MIIDNDFWERNPKEVAKDLVGKSIFEFYGLNNIIGRGILTEVAAYERPLENRSPELFDGRPGTIGMFSSRRGGITVVTAHAQRRTGLVTLRGMLNGETNYGVVEIGRLLGVKDLTGSQIGHESGIYVGVPGIDFKALGLGVIDVPLGEKSPENRVAHYRLGRI